MRKESLIVEIKNGKINKALPVKDGRYWIEVAPLNTRSNNQNRFLHGVLIPEFRNGLLNVGYNIPNNAQAKEIMKKMFLTRQVVNENTGEVIEYVQDTASLTKEEMNILYDDVIRFAAENLDWQIKYPNEQLEFFNSDVIQLPTETTGEGDGSSRA